MELFKIKQLSVLSLILGTLLGICSLIPYLGLIAFLACIFILGTAVVIFMQRMNILPQIDTKQMAILGAIGGFVGFIGFCIAFIPIASIIGLIVKTAYYYSILIMVKSGFFMTIFIVIAIALISSVMNSFGAMIASYLINFYNTEIKK